MEQCLWLLPHATLPWLWRVPWLKALLHNIACSLPSLPSREWQWPGNTGWNESFSRTLLLVRSFYQSYEKKLEHRHSICKKHPTKYCQPIEGSVACTERILSRKSSPAFSAVCVVAFWQTGSFPTFPWAIFGARTSTSGEPLGHFCVKGEHSMGVFECTCSLDPSQPPGLLLWRAPSIRWGTDCFLDSPQEGLNAPLSHPCWLHITTYWLSTPLLLMWSTKEQLDPQQLLPQNSNIKAAPLPNSPPFRTFNELGKVKSSPATS